MMKRTITTILGVAGLCSAAAAADLPARIQAPAAMAAPPLFAWTGLYLGGQVGAAWQSDRVLDTSTCAPCFDQAVGRGAGLLGGAHAGFLARAAALAWGAELDFEGLGVQHTTIYPRSAPDTFAERLLWQGSLRARLGYAAGSSLFYVTGGAAFGDFRRTYFEAISGNSQSFSRTQPGWTIGAGIEQVLTGRWTARVEYRYTDFSRVNDTPSLVFPGFVEHHRDTQHAVRVGLSYHL